MKVSGSFLLLCVIASCTSFYIIAPPLRNKSPFCYINALSMTTNNVLHWKVLEPRPANFTLYVTITNKFGEVIEQGKSSLEDDTLGFQYKARDVIRICVESEMGLATTTNADSDEEGLRVHVGYQLAKTEQKDGKLATAQQADRLNMIVYDASNKLENFMVSEDNINNIIDGIHDKSMVVAKNLKFTTKLEVFFIVMIFLFQFWHLRRFLLSKRI